MAALANGYISAQLISSFGQYTVHHTACWELGIEWYMTVSQYPFYPLALEQFLTGHMSTQHKGYISQLPLKLGVTVWLIFWLIGQRWRGMYKFQSILMERAAYSSLPPVGWSHVLSSLGSWEWKPRLAELHAEMWCCWTAPPALNCLLQEIYARQKYVLLSFIRLLFGVSVPSSRTQS